MVLRDRPVGLVLVILSIVITAQFVDTCLAMAEHIRWAVSVHQPTGIYWLCLIFCAACAVFAYTVTAQHFRRR